MCNWRILFNRDNDTEYSTSYLLSTWFTICCVLLLLVMWCFASIPQSNFTCTEATLKNLGEYINWTPLCHDVTKYINNEVSQQTKHRPHPWAYVIHCKKSYSVPFWLSYLPTLRYDNKSLSQVWCTVKLSITTTLWYTSLPSGAHLGGQGPPRWAPEGKNC